MPRIYVLAGVNGAGKSSIGGAMIRAAGGQYYNPDEAARQLMVVDPRLAQTAANGQAWLLGKTLLEKAITHRLDFAFESTLGAKSIPALLRNAAQQGFEIFIWYAGLSSPQLHISRVAARVTHGGHDIPETDIRRRYESSRINLIDLLPHLTALRIFDNSADGNPVADKEPKPALVLHVVRGKILNPTDLPATPDWAKPIVAEAMKLDQR